MNFQDFSYPVTFISYFHDLCMTVCIMRYVSWGSAWYPVETGRRDKIERFERLEYHFLFSCTLNANLRSTILGNMTPNHQNFIRIMTTDNEQIINKISNFEYCAFKLRKESLSSV